MKKLLAGLCVLLMSSQAFAYQGATLYFTKEIFQSGVVAAIANNTNNASKYDCAVAKIKPSMNVLAQRYLDDVLTKQEVKLLDEFFDKPLGKAMLVEVKNGNIENFGDSLDWDKYDESDYEQELPIFEKFFDNDKIDQVMSSDEFTDSIIDTVVECKLYEE